MLGRKIDTVLRQKYGKNRQLRLSVNIDLTQPVIPARYARGLLEAAEPRGLSHSGLMSQARISESDLGGRHARISAKQFS